MGTLSDQPLAQGQKLGWIQGEKVGFQRGLEQKEREDVQNMYMNTISIDQITKILKISEVKVRTYISDMTKH